MHNSSLADHLNKKYASQSDKSDLPERVAWYTYPLLEFLENLDFSQDTVFEYGSGSSSIYWANKAKYVQSVEHDYHYYKEALRLKEELDINNLSLKLASNEVLVSDPERVYEFISGLKPLASLAMIKLLSSTMATENLSFLNSSTRRIRNSGSFSYLPSEYLMALPISGQSFDLIIVDGMNRSLSGIIAAQKLNNNGIIILDNSDRPMYFLLKQYLSESNFQEIPFVGPGPFNQYTWCTSIFVQSIDAIKSRSKSTNPRYHRIWF